MIFGVLPQKKNQYALRILGNCGEFTSEELLRLSELTAKFGNGKITATSRGTFELNGVSESELEPAIEAVQAAKLRLGGTGARQFGLLWHAKVLTAVKVCLMCMLLPAD